MGSRSSANAAQAASPTYCALYGREYAIATVMVTGNLGRFYDETRLEVIARQAAAAAEEHPTEPPPRPGRLVLTYP